MRSLTDSLYRGALNSWLSYRALFTWLNPAGYLSSRLLAPLLVALIFGSLAGAGERDTVGVVFGAALYAVFLSGLMGSTLAVANERRFGTLSSWVGSGQRISVGLCCRTLPHVVDGLFSGAFTLAVAAWLLDLPVDADAIAHFAAAAPFAGLAGISLGLFSVAVSLRFRDTFSMPNILHSLILVTSGAVIPADRYPAALRWLGEALPLGHAMAFLDAALTLGRTPWAELLVEFVVDLCYGAAACLLICVLLHRARVQGSFELS